MGRLRGDQHGAGRAAGQRGGNLIDVAGIVQQHQHPPPESRLRYKAAWSSTSVGISAVDTPRAVRNPHTATNGETGVADGPNPRRSTYDCPSGNFSRFPFAGAGRDVCNTAVPTMENTAMGRELPVPVLPVCAAQGRRASALPTKSLSTAGSWWGTGRRRRSQYRLLGRRGSRSAPRGSISDCRADRSSAINSSGRSARSSLSTAMNATSDRGNGGAGATHGWWTARCPRRASPARGGRVRPPRAAGYDPGRFPNRRLNRLAASMAHLDMHPRARLREVSGCPPADVHYPIRTHLKPS